MTDRLLDDAKRLVLAWPGRTVPLMTPMAFWWDGQHVWLSTAGSSLKARRLRKDPTCAMWVPPVAPDATAGHGDGEVGQADSGLLLRGQARVFHLGDPLGLTVHAGLLAAAQTALMLKNAPSMVGYIVDAPKIPQAFMPNNRVLIRVSVSSREQVAQPPVEKGIAPALPTEVPPEIRRTLSGKRRIVLATQIDGGLGLMPAVWGAGFSLQVPTGMGLVDGTVATAVLDHDPGFRPSAVEGVSLTGRISTAGPSPTMPPTLAPSKVRWWSGFDLQTAELSLNRTDTIVIPD